MSATAFFCGNVGFCKIVNIFYGIRNRGVKRAVNIIIYLINGGDVISVHDLIRGVVEYNLVGDEIVVFSLGYGRNSNVIFPAFVIFDGNFVYSLETEGNRIFFEIGFCRNVIM